MNLKTLLLHGNPISSLPISLSKIWSGIQEFSIDWLTYILPHFGRIIKLEPQRAISASRIRVSDAPSGSYVANVKTSKVSQKDKAR